MAERTTRDVGKEAEDFAFGWLTAAGLRPLVRNYSVRGGEIDLILLDHDTLVFVEVRYRHRDNLIDGAQSVGSSKRARIIRAAKHYLVEAPEWYDKPCRFDVLSLEEGTAGGPRYRPDWIQNAFDVGNPW